MSGKGEYLRREVRDQALAVPILYVDVRPSSLTYRRR